MTQEHDYDLVCPRFGRVGALIFRFISMCSRACARGGRENEPEVSAYKLGGGWGTHDKEERDALEPYTGAIDLKP